MSSVLPHFDLGFCTDGDWVAKDTTGKLSVLRQGCDIRVAGADESSSPEIDVLFTGIGDGGGVVREHFVRSMRTTYGARFHHSPNGIHGRELRQLVANSKVVVCPPSPVTQKYWSNRIYLMAGFGGCVVHPFCADLEKEYIWGEHVSYYTTQKEMEEEIDYLLSNSVERRSLSSAALERTLASYTYTDRCRDLVARVEQYRSSQ